MAHWKLHASHQPGGFTLVELIVVVSIIALMVSILLPALKQARATAHRMVCQTNLRQNFLGMTMYYHDYPQWPGTLGGGEWISSYGQGWQYILQNSDWSDEPVHMGKVLGGRYLDSGMSLYCPAQQWRTYASTASSTLGAHRFFDHPPKKIWLGYTYRIANNRTDYHHSGYQYRTRELNLHYGAYIMACPLDSRAMPHEGAGVSGLWQDGGIRWVHSVSGLVTSQMIDAAYAPFAGADY